MIIVKLIGGLANQMGIYAAGRALSVQCNVPLKLDLSSLADNQHRMYELDKLNIKAEIAMPEEIQQLSRESRFHMIDRIKKSLKKRLHIKNPHIYKETSLVYDANFLQLSAPVYVLGSFPSLLYYKSIFGLLRNELSIKLPLSRNSQIWLDKISSTCSVAMHFRRGDYVSNPKATAFHGVLGLRYYEAAVNLMRNKYPQAEFFVFSDDMEWVKNNITFTGVFHYVDCNNAENGYQDYWLMRHCRHHIVANSGFSRWAALLCDYPDQQVIRPARWTTHELLRDEDIGPSSWILIDN